MTTTEERWLPITPRERELVRLLARGLTEKQCAAEMGIKPGTVATIANLLRYKLRVRDRRQLPMAYWRETGDDPFPEDV